MDTNLTGLLMGLRLRHGMDIMVTEEGNFYGHQEYGVDTVLHDGKFCALQNLLASIEALDRELKEAASE